LFIFFPTDYLLAFKYYFVWKKSEKEIGREREKEKGGKGERE